MFQLHLRFFVFILLSLGLLGGESAALAKKNAGQKPIQVKKEMAVKVPEAKPECPISSIPIDFTVAAKQMIVLDYETGAVLLQKDPDELLHPSSMTKILTVMVVEDYLKSGRIKPETVFTVTKEAFRLEGSSMFLNLNQEVTVLDLLKGAIIQSGNDACVTLAVGIAGSEAVFAAEMTRKAHALGAIHTSFKNTSGLPDPEHLTTARDLALISIHAIRDYPEFYHLYKEKEFTFNNIKQGNRNPLLYRNMNCDGIKTGHTDIGGYGVVASAMRDGQRVIVVVNGLTSQQKRADETAMLMTWALNTFTNVTLFKKGQEVAHVPLSYGVQKQVMATVANDCVITLPRVSEKDLKTSIQIEPKEAPIQAGDAVGTVTISAPTLVQPIRIPLVAAASVERAGFVMRLIERMGKIF